MSPQETNYFVHSFEATSHYVDHKERAFCKPGRPDIIDSERST